MRNLINYVNYIWKKGGVFHHISIEITERPSCGYDSGFPVNRTYAENH